MLFILRVPSLDFLLKSHFGSLQIRSILLFEITRKLDDLFNRPLLIFSAFSNALEIDHFNFSYYGVLLSSKRRKNRGKNRCYDSNNLKDNIMQQSIPKDGAVRWKNVFRSAIASDVNIWAEIVFMNWLIIPFDHVIFWRIKPFLRFQAVMRQFLWRIEVSSR